MSAKEKGKSEDMAKADQARYEGSIAQNGRRTSSLSTAKGKPDAAKVVVKAEKSKKKKEEEEEEEDEEDEEDDDE
ncbi:hypothetical protein GW7_04534 [Heterocephalus glaber]|uniref:Uncharacterized protein n=1 Tax=Heterocephalus glaber TaxID=10181 RepID=G5BLV9_HETGA|nr:hypothetical protein GW7_04534 [Heterocephalus glaber]